MLRDLSTQPRQQLDEQRPLLLLIEVPIFLPAERSFSFVMSLDIIRGLFDKLERQLVTRLVIVGPVDEAMLPEHDAFETFVSTA